MDKRICVIRLFDLNNRLYLIDKSEGKSKIILNDILYNDGKIELIYISRYELISSDLFSIFSDKCDFEIFVLYKKMYYNEIKYGDISYEKINNEFIKLNRDNLINDILN